MGPGAVHRGCLRVQAGVNSGIKTVTDLKGKRIGVPGIGTPPYILAVRALVAAGLDPKKDVEFLVYPAEQFDMVLTRGLVDEMKYNETGNEVRLVKYFGRK